MTGLIPCRPGVIEPVQNSPNAAFEKIAVEIPSRDTKPSYASSGQLGPLSHFAVVGSTTTHHKYAGILVHAAEHEYLSVPIANA